MAMQIGDLIRMKREEHGLTQEQLAELIGKSAGYIGQLERGLSMASIPTLKRLVNVLSLDARSEERRVGKECRSRWSPYH